MLFWQSGRVLWPWRKSAASCRLKNAPRIFHSKLKYVYHLKCLIIKIRGTYLHFMLVTRIRTVIVYVCVCVSPGPSHIGLSFVSLFFPLRLVAQYHVTQRLLFGNYVVVRNCDVIWNVNEYNQRCLQTKGKSVGGEKRTKYSASKVTVAQRRAFMLNRSDTVPRIKVYLINIRN